MKRRKYFILITVVVVTVVAVLAFSVRAKSPKEGEVADKLPEAGIYPVGTVLQADLNGDGEEETFRIGTEYSQVRDETYHVVDIESELWGDVQRQMASEEYLYLARLDRESAWMAIGIPAVYSDTSSSTEFYRYTEGKLECVGMASGTPEGSGYERMYVDEDGVVHSYKLLSLPTWWYAPVEMQLDETGRLQEVEREYYEPIQGEQEVTLRYELPVYDKPVWVPVEEREEDWEAETMAPQKVQFTATDDRNWCKLQGEDGSEGWFYVEDWTQVADLGLEMNEVFENLGKISETCRQLIRLLGQPVAAIEGLPERNGLSDRYIWKQNMARTPFTVTAVLNDEQDYIQEIWLDSDLLDLDDAQWRLSDLYRMLSEQLDGAEYAGEDTTIPEILDQWGQINRNPNDHYIAKTSWRLAGEAGDGGTVSLMLQMKRDYLDEEWQYGAVIRILVAKDV